MYLFTYGTLRMNAAHPMAEKIAKNAILVGLGYIKKAKLFQIDWYPALIESTDENDLVIGDVYRLNNHDFLAELDEYENIGIGTPSFEYRREKKKVFFEEENETVDCWIYFYNWPIPERASLIESGDFLNP